MQPTSKPNKSKEPESVSQPQEQVVSVEALRAESQAVVPVFDPDAAPAVPSVVINSHITPGAISGAISREDFAVARLNVAYGVGTLSAKFAPGDLVLNGEHLIARKNEPVYVVVLAAVKYFKERLAIDQFNKGQRPRVYFDEQSVLRAGGTLQWVDGPNGKRIAPTFGPAMDIRLLIQKPKNVDCPLFSVVLDGSEYAMVDFSVDKSAYNRVARPLVSESSWALRGQPLWAGIWKLWTTVEQINEYPTIVPRLQLLSLRTTEKFRAELAELLSTLAPPTVVEETDPDAIDVTETGQLQNGLQDIGPKTTEAF